MKILTILNEAKFVKPEYVYHATKLEHLPSILKHGLIPNKEEGGYGSEETSSMGYSQSPLNGVYFTRSQREAVEIAKSFFDEAVVIICKVQSRTAEMDEDRLTDIVDERALMKELRAKIGDYEKYERDGFDEAEQDALAKTYTKSIIDSRLKHLNPKLISHIYPYLLKYVESLIIFYVESEIEHNYEDSDVKANQRDLSKQLRQLVKNKTASHTLKIDDTITFSGANRIVGIYDVNSRVGWGDLGGLKNYEFHIVKSPQELLYKK